MSTTTDKPSFAEWAKVELFGHNVIIGKVTEATLAGGSFIRVDVPAFGSEPAYTRFFGPSAIYSISPLSEEIARGLLTRYQNVPVNRYELPQLAEHVTDNDQERDDDMDDDDDQPPQPGHPDDTLF